MDNMIRFDSTKEFLFVTELQPAPEDVRAPRPEGEISTALGALTDAKCTVGVGKPLSYPLNDFYQTKSIPLPESILMLAGNLTNYTFFVVHLSCYFLSEKNCRAEEARLDVQLHGGNNKKDKPLVLDLYPSKVITPTRKRKVTTKIGADLKFLGSDVTGEYLAEFEQESYEPEIISYGVLTQQFRWKFRRTKEHALEGNRELFAIIGKPAGMQQVTATFKVTVEVKTTALKWLVLDSRHDVAVKVPYRLC